MAQSEKPGRPSTPRKPLDAKKKGWSTLRCELSTSLGDDRQLAIPNHYRKVRGTSNTYWDEENQRYVVFFRGGIMTYSGDGKSDWLVDGEPDFDGFVVYESEEDAEEEYTEADSGLRERTLDHKTHFTRGAPKWAKEIEEQTQPGAAQNEESHPVANTEESTTDQPTSPVTATSETITSLATAPGSEVAVEKVTEEEGSDEVCDDPEGQEVEEVDDEPEGFNPPFSGDASDSDYYEDSDEDEDAGNDPEVEEEDSLSDNSDESASSTDDHEPSAQGEDDDDGWRATDAIGSGDELSSSVELPPPPVAVVDLPGTEGAGEGASSTTSGGADGSAGADKAVRPAKVFIGKRKRSRDDNANESPAAGENETSIARKKAKEESVPRKAEDDEAE